MNKISNKDFETLFQELIVTDSDDKTKLKEEFKTLKSSFSKRHRFTKIKIHLFIGQKMTFAIG
jgi:hypothetical protein